jgi:4-hydroxy-3-methylbut-2-enyl diphosphate reductase
MSTEAPAAPQKINLRRPDIMEAVQAQVLSHYRSELVERIRASGHILSAGNLTIKLAKEFGFCYGVERAIDLAYAARRAYPDRRIFLLGEIIHNPEVNDQIKRMGIVTIAGKPQDEEINQLRPEDIVIIPAFGTEVATRKKLEAKGCSFVDTTCGDVMSVWKRVRQYSKDAVTSIIHGKSWHEETMATSSQARASGNGHYLVVFLTKFKGAYSEGFDPEQHLQAIGVANQTTMLRGETEEVQRRLKAAMAAKYGDAELSRHFRFFDTICGATQDRQDALEKLLRDPLDLLLVIGGYNSSNTSHLAEMGEAKLPTYFIKNAAKMISDKLIHHYEQHKHEEIETRNWLPEGRVTVGITAGASCPNNLIEDTIRRLFELRGISVQQLLAA